MSTTSTFRVGVTLLFISALAGLLLALYAYFAPLTGVTKSVGALAVIVVCVLLGVMAFLLGAARSRTTLVVLRVLVAIALVSICFAAALLHQWWICAAMGLGAIGLIIELARPTANRAVYS